MEGMKVLFTDVVDIIEKTQGHFYKWLQFEDINDDEYLMVLNVLSFLTFELETLAEETDETNDG